MILELTPENFFEHIHREGPLHVIMHYGMNCGPCKSTMPHYEILASHFEQHKITNVKFYKFHQWEQSYRPFIEEHSLKVSGVPTFRYYYFVEKLHEVTSGYGDPNVMKGVIVEVVKGIESTMGSFSLYEN
jgi:thiol-disulfide isomerase/thioredoxin